MNPNDEPIADDAATLPPAEGFARLAYTYDARLAGNPMLLRESPLVLSALPDLAGSTVADVGCGTGRYALQMARMGAESVVGVDVVGEMLTQARRKAERGDIDCITWEQADVADALPLADGTLDAAVAAFVLSYLSAEGLETFFVNVSRALATGGTLVISDHHPQWLTRARAALNGDGPFLRFMAEDGLDYRVRQYVHQFGDLFHAARNAGLTLVRVGEPLVDRDLLSRYPRLHDEKGMPLALILQFVKQI